MFQVLFTVVLVAVAAYFLYYSYDSELGFDFKKGAGAVAALGAAALAWFADMWASMPF